jgi:hypothetical protein
MIQDCYRKFQYIYCFHEIKNVLPASSPLLPAAQLAPGKVLLEGSPSLRFMYLVFFCAYVWEHPLGQTLLQLFLAFEIFTARALIIVLIAGVLSMQGL